MRKPRYKHCPVRRSVLSGTRPVSMERIRINTMRALAVVCVVLVSSALQAQTPAYDLGGASKPRPDMSLKRDNQYKRVHQVALRYILLGEFDQAGDFLTNYLDSHPDDAETLYMLGVLHGSRKQTDAAVDFLRRAIAAGLPEERILAGPRSLMTPVFDTPFYTNLAAKYADRPIHGPLLGSVTDTSAAFWIRTTTAANVTVTVSESPLFEESTSAAGTSAASEDFTAVVRLSGLSPSTEYHYAIAINGGPLNYSSAQTFRTFSVGGQPAKFVLAFGGGAGYVPTNERMWDTIGNFHPDALLLLGDNVYIDDPESVTMQQYTYQRRQSRPEWRRLTAQTSVFTIWDDHDFSTNDSWGGADIAIPFWKKEFCFPIFRQNWANPGYAGGDAQPGCWYRFQIADVDFIMLDCRYYRTSPRSQHPTMLGTVQMKWLKEQLQSATGTFKVVCSSVPWDFRTKGDSLDTWNGFKAEREEIFSFIEANDVEGVLLMSADRHRSDAWFVERADGYGFYEFNSSRLTNQHIHPTMEKKGALFSFNHPQSFGLVSFDTTADDPQVVYEIVDINGNKPHRLKVNRSQLNLSSGR